MQLHFDSRKTMIIALLSEYLYLQIASNVYCQLKTPKTVFIFTWIGKTICSRSIQKTKSYKDQATVLNAICFRIILNNLMEFALIVVRSTLTNSGTSGKAHPDHFQVSRWVGNGWIQESVISMADLTSWQARYLNEFTAYSWTETYCSIIHEFHALISTVSFLFFFLKGWDIFLYKKCKCRDGQFFKALKSLHLFAALSPNMLIHLGLLAWVQTCSRTTSLK